MQTILKGILGAVVMFSLLIPAVHAEEVSREQIKGLDEQVQEIKGDVLAIAAELNRLEEKLLYPSNSQINLFVALENDDPSQIDSVEVSLDGEPVAHHLYTFKELSALRKGGVQRLYTGNIKTGEHELAVKLIGQNEGGSTFHRSGTYTVRKELRPEFVEIILSGNAISFSDR